MKNLISMTDFIELLRDEMISKGPLSNKKTYKYFDKVFFYSDFLKQTLKDEMFKGEKALFVFEEHKDSYKHHILQGRTVEYYTQFPNVRLTDYALKEIGL